MADVFYVVDGEDNTLWCGKEKDDHPQTFQTFKAAEKRAKEAAGYEPGTEMKVVKVVAIVSCPVGKPETQRR